VNDLLGQESTNAIESWLASREADYVTGREFASDRPTVSGAANPNSSSDNNGFASRLERHMTRP